MLPYNVRSAMESVGGILKRHPNSSNAGGTTSSSAAHHGGLRAGEARQVDLLVFGYACKVFRDDDKAKDIDQGKHLIPWMGDNSLKIDRYDVRGALYELATHEPPPGGYGNRLDHVSADEQRAEQLCEEERYLFLYNNEEELILQQEEELKRLKLETNGTYNQVEFSYGDSDARSRRGEQESISPGCGEENEEAFKLSPDFVVPASVQLPETVKQHAIIEKTARFIASQGVQMEILLKAKQSNNLQFEFLNANSTLNAYYKCVMNAIKNGTYPEREIIKVDLADDPLKSPEAQAQPEPLPKAVITVPIVKYKPSVNCAYTQLISKITGVPLPAVIDESTNTSATDSPISTPTPVMLQYNGNTTTFVTEEADGNSNSNSNSNSTNNAANISADGSIRVELLINSSALAMAQNYASDSENDDEDGGAAPKEEVIEKVKEPELHFPIPPESLRNIIDKTAVYVVKNGRQFEETLRSKSEDRFTFLLPENEHYPYYMYKITGDPDAASKEQKTRKAAAVAAALLTKKGLNKDKAVTPVSFCIKPKDDNSVGSMQPALPQEASDDEEQQTSPQQQNKTAMERNVPEQVQKAILLVESQLMARNATQLGVNPRSRFDVVCPLATAAVAAAAVAVAGNTTAALKGAKADQERNALFEQQQQTRYKELKKAEEKVKDKLAQIAREKLGGLITKEKQLQLERKRKAMAFLNQIKGSDDTTAEEITNAEEHTPAKLPTDKEDDDESADSQASVHSIPITSYGPEEKSDEEIPVECPLPPSLAVEDEPSQQSPAAKVNVETPTTEEPTTFTVSDDDDVQLVNEIKAPPPPSIKKSHRQHAKRASKSKHSSRSHSRSRSHTRANGSSGNKSHKKKRSVSESSSDDSGKISSSISESSPSSSSLGDTGRKHRSHSSRKRHSKSKVKKSSSKGTSSTSVSASSAHKQKKKSKKRSRSPSEKSHHTTSSHRSKRSKHSRSHGEHREYVEEKLAHSRREHRHERMERSRSRSRSRDCRNHDDLEYARYKSARKHHHSKIK